MLSIPLNNGVKSLQKPHCLSASTDLPELWITHANIPAALSLFKNMILLHHDVIQKNISFIETN